MTYINADVIWRPTSKDDKLQYEVKYWIVPYKTVTVSKALFSLLVSYIWFIFTAVKAFPHSVLRCITVEIYLTLSIYSFVLSKILRKYIYYAFTLVNVLPLLVIVNQRLPNKDSAQQVRYVIELNLIVLRLDVCT